MAAQEPPILIVNRLFDSSLTALADDDTSVTDYNKANEFVIVFQVDEVKGPWTTTYSLRWRNVTDAGAFAVIGSSGEMAWGTGTDLVHQDPITARMCQATGGSGSTWQNGEQVEGAAVCDSIALADEYYTEVAFAVDPSGAHAGDQYEFELYDNGNSSPIGTGVAKVTITTGGISFAVGLPSGAGATLAPTVIGDALVSAGLPSALAEVIACTATGGTVFAVGLPAGAGAPLATVSTGAALVAAGLPSAVAEALSTTQLFDYVFTVGLPSALGEPLSVVVSTGAEPTVVVVGIPAGLGETLAVTATGGALVSAGLPSALAEAIAVVVTGGANVTVGIPSGLAEAIATGQLYDYVFSVGIPSGAGVALPVTVWTDGVPAFTFYVSQIVPLEE